MKRPRGFIHIPVLVLILVVLTAGFFYLRQRSSRNEVEKTAPTPPPATSVKYNEREKIFEIVKYPEDANFIFETFDFYKIGKITSGKYKDGDLILVLADTRGPCKGEGCDRLYRLRYILKENVAIFLPTISSTEATFIEKDIDFNSFNLFQNFGLNLASDPNFTIPILEYPEEIRGENPRQVLKIISRYEEDDGLVDESLLEAAFEHEIFGKVYTTKSGVGPSNSFYTYSGPPESGLDPLEFWSINGCRGKWCFTTNAFFVFRPDGTFLKYTFEYDFEENNYKTGTNGIIWNDQVNNQASYSRWTVAGICGDDILDYFSVVSPNLLADDDLEITGKVETTGEPIYAIKDKKHQFYLEFYENYKKHSADWDLDYTGTDHPKTYEAFLASRPMFFWKDPFSRLIRFNNKDFVPPTICEPIIYLYPERKQQVDVSLGENVKVTNSSPSYQNGWKVIVEPSGRITSASDYYTYPYLFWEGWSAILPLQKEGFVVEKSGVEEFLRGILPMLGLNEEETADFLNAWLREFTNSPYYFITFIPQEIIDKIAPLKVSPKPDTLIRVLMDYKRLEKPVEVSPLSINEPPPRKGFTVVEWGGVKR